MRKKSHISLARYIVNNMEDNDLKKHKLSFYIGSVLPDIKPSFVYKRHEMDGTYPDIRRHIERLSEGRKLVEKKKPEMPARGVNVMKCKNPRCITQTEQELDQIFVLADREKQIYRCFYCEAAHKSE